MLVVWSYVDLHCLKPACCCASWLVFKVLHAVVYIPLHSFKHDTGEISWAIAWCITSILSRLRNGDHVRLSPIMWKLWCYTFRAKLPICVSISLVMPTRPGDTLALSCLSCMQLIEGESFSMTAENPALSSLMCSFDYPLRHSVLWWVYTT